MGWLDKLLGRTKQAAGDMTGDSSIQHEDEHQEQAAASGVFLMRLLRAELAAQRQETRAELAARSSEIGRRLEGLDGRLLSTQQSAGQTATQIVEKIGELGRTSAQMLQRANDLARLEQALRPPKARGGVGELLLANVLRDSLPADAYELQH